jgi:hypothetical protein
MVINSKHSLSSVLPVRPCWRPCPGPSLQIGDRPDVPRGYMRRGMLELEYTPSAPGSRGILPYHGDHRGYQEYFSVRRQLLPELVIVRYGP